MAQNCPMFFQAIYLFKGTTKPNSMFKVEAVGGPIIGEKGEAQSAIPNNLLLVVFEGVRWVMESKKYPIYNLTRVFFYYIQSKFTIQIFLAKDMKPKIFEYIISSIKKHRYTEHEKDKILL